MLTAEAVYQIAKELSKKELCLLQDKINTDLEEKKAPRKTAKKYSNEISEDQIMDRVLQRFFNSDTSKERKGWCMLFD
jgi:hypothetical protein